MVVNHGGNLSKDYFAAYLKLIMTAKNCSALCAKEDMFQRFFKGQSGSYGPSSFDQFNIASKELIEARP